LGLVEGADDEGAEASPEEHDDHPMHAERIGATEHGHGDTGNEHAEKDNQGVLAFAGG
jgi:hypothetical protein